MKSKHVIIIVCILVVAVAIGLLTLPSDEIENVTEEQNISLELANDGDNEASKGSSLSGQVMDGMSHKALRATVLMEASDQTMQTANCNDNGRYQFNISDGKYRISATFKGYVPRGKNEQSYAIEFNEDDDKGIVQNIELWPESKIVGRIVNNNAGVSTEVKLAYQVDASGAENYEFQSMTTSDNGEFSFDMAYAGTVKLIMNADGFPEQRLNDIELEPGKTVDLGDIPLSYGTLIQGMVLDKKTQSPIPNANLQFIEKDNVISEATSDENGVYQFSSIIGTGLQLKTVAEGYQDDVTSVIIAGDTKQKYNVYLTPIEGISLAVNNITGREPILSTVTITDIPSDKVIYNKELENGTYKLPDLTEGPYLFTAVSADGESTATVRATGGNAVRLTLKPYGKITIQFVMSDPNVKFQEGKYQYTYESEDDQSIVSDWVSTTSDTITLTDLKPGTYTFEGQTLSSDQHGWINLGSKPVHLNMGDNEFVRLTLANANNLIHCHFPEDENSPEMSNAVSDCMKKANELQQMFMSYLEVDYYSDNPTVELQNYLITASGMLTQFSPAYNDIIQHTKDPEVRSLSMFKLGESFDKVGQFILSSPVPEHLPPEVEQQYKGLLSEYSNLFYQKASGFYEKLIPGEENNNYKSEYSARAASRLEELKKSINP